MTALVADAELPPKIGVHPRPTGSFAHAMPAALRPTTSASSGASRDAGDLLGIKWVAGFPDNRAKGLPTIHAVVVLTDAATGVPRAILDGGPITAQRTAAVSGVAIARFGPMAAATAGAADHPPRATLIGAGVQGDSHLEVLGYVLPGVTLTIVDRHPDRAEALAETARRTAGIAGADAVAPDRMREAAHAADVVVTAASFTDPAKRQVMARGLAEPRRARRPRRLRDDARGVGRPRGGAVPGRRSRPVPRESRRRPVRRLPGPDGHDRRGDPQRDDPARERTGRRDASRRRPRRRRVRGRHRPSGRGRLGLGTALPR